MGSPSTSPVREQAAMRPCDVACTAELNERAERAPQLQLENEAYRRLARCLASTPAAMLQAIADQALLLCKAGSSGVTLLENHPEGSVLFRWVALAGAAAPHTGGSSPRDFSPCGMCLDENRPILLAHPERCFTYFQPLGLPIVEALILPLQTHDQVFGTIWIMSHDPTRQFDNEDLRVMSGLADMTAAALRRNALITQVQRANADLEQFAYLASHDLQEPLRTVRSYTQLLMRRYKGKLDPDADAFLAHIDEGTARMDALMRGLLTYAHLTQHAPADATVDLAALVESAWRSCEAHIQETGAEIVVGPLPHARGDADQLLHVVQNLLSNAIRYRSTSRPRVEVTGKRDGRMVEVAIKDNGIGIEPAYQAKIFGMFKRLSSTEGGAGIGLALCQRVIERHGGRIWVESTPVEGSTFRFTLLG